MQQRSRRRGGTAPGLQSGFASFLPTRPELHRRVLSDARSRRASPFTEHFSLEFHMPRMCRCSIAAEVTRGGVNPHTRQSEFARLNCSGDDWRTAGLASLSTRPVKFPAASQNEGTPDCKSRRGTHRAERLPVASTAATLRPPWQPVLLSRLAGLLRADCRN